MGSKSIFLERLRVQKVCPPRKPELQKNVIFLRENAIFFKIDDFGFEVEVDEKHTKNVKKKMSSKSMFLLTSIFLRFWTQLGWIFGPKLGSNKFSAPRLFPNGVQVAPKSSPGGDQEAPKSAQETPER